MRRQNKPKSDDTYLKSLGRHLGRLIEKRGYSSPYDFWIQVAGDHISRSSLNNILTGKSDPKATTLRMFARLLGVPPKELLDFKD